MPVLAASLMMAKNFLPSMKAFFSCRCDVGGGGSNDTAQQTEGREGRGQLVVIKL
jgi:hypothetical protein